MWFYFWSSWICCHVVQWPAFPHAKQHLILCSSYIPYAFIGFHLPFFVGGVPSPSSLYTVSSPHATSAREVCTRHVGYLSMSESLLAFLSRYQIQPWRVFPFPVILWRILECLSLLPIGSSWLWIYTLSIWCVHGQFAYVYFVCVSASLRKWSDHHSVLLGKLSLVFLSLGKCA